MAKIHRFVSNKIQQIWP